MSKKNNEDYELRDEYDFSKMTILPKGRFAPGRRVGSNVVLLAPDVARVFPNDETVNTALRLVIKLKQIKTRPKRKAA